jgi:hypothetical protein
MPFKVRKVGRLQVKDKSSRPYKFEILNNDEMLSITRQSWDCKEKNYLESRGFKPISQAGSPVKEPGQTPEPLLPPSHPPVEEPPNEPGGPLWRGPKGQQHGKIDPILGIHDLRLPENGDSNAILDVILFCYIIFAMLFMQLRSKYGRQYKKERL